MSIALDSILTGTDTTTTITFNSGGSAFNIGASPTTLQIVWTPNQAGASTITKTGTVVGDGSAGQATFNLAAADYAALTAPVDLYGVATVVTASAITITEELMLPIRVADFPGTVGLCTLSELKRHLAITTEGDDDRLIGFIRAATKRIEAITNRQDVGFMSSTVTEIFDGQNDESLILTKTPVSSVTSVTVTDSTGTSTISAATDYRVNLNSGVLSLIGAKLVLASGVIDRQGFNLAIGGPSEGLHRRPAFPLGRQNISVVYVGGYAPSAIPDDLRLACLSIASRMFQSTKSDPSMQSESLGDISYSRFGSADEDDRERRMLASWIVRST